MYKLNILKGLPWFHFLIDDLYVIPIYVLPHFMKHMDIGFKKLLLVNMNTKNNKSNTVLKFGPSIKFSLI